MGVWGEPREEQAGCPARPRIGQAMRMGFGVGGSIGPWQGVELGVPAGVVMRLRCKRGGMKGQAREPGGG